jgi:transcriptional regulator with XRE-family HTH domain
VRKRVDPRFDHSRLEYELHDDLPPGWRHPVTGRKKVVDDPALEQLGIYVRRARYIVGQSQQELADAAKVPQSQISRLERGLAPAMNVERLAWIEHALDGAFPVGYCPHDHVCRWRRLKPRPTAEEAWEAEVEKQRRLTERFYGSQDSDSAELDEDADDDPEVEAFLLSLANE